MDRVISSISNGKNNAGVGGVAGKNPFKSAFVSGVSAYVRDAGQEGLNANPGTLAAGQWTGGQADWNRCPDCAFSLTPGDPRHPDGSGGSDPPSH